MRNPDAPEPYTREITFAQVGLHTSGIEPLTVRGTYQIDLTGAVSRHVERYLAPSTQIKVRSHPDDPRGFIYERTTNGQEGRLLGEFTVSLPEASHS